MGIIDDKLIDKVVNILRVSIFEAYTQNPETKQTLLVDWTSTESNVKSWENKLRVFFGQNFGSIRRFLGFLIFILAQIKDFSTLDF